MRSVFLEGTPTGLETSPTLRPAPRAMSSLEPTLSALATLESTLRPASLWTGCSLRAWCLRFCELISGEKIFRSHVKHLSLLKAARIDSFGWFNTEVEGVEGTENLIHNTYFGLILQINRPIKLGEPAHVRALHHEAALRAVHV